MTPEQQKYWSESPRDKGYTHYRGERTEQGFNPVLLPEVMIQWYSQMMDIADGRDIWIRGFHIKLEREFDREDLTLVCYTRFSAKNPSKPRHDR